MTGDGDGRRYAIGVCHGHLGGDPDRFKFGLTSCEVSRDWRRGDLHTWTDGAKCSEIQP